MKNISVKKILKVILNLFIGVVFLMPFYWMFLTALKTLVQAIKIPPDFWVIDPQWQNFVTAFNAIPFLAMLKNSLVVAVAIMVCQFLTVIPAAYAFARFRFKGQHLIFGSMLVTMMIPPQLIFLPVFLMFSKWGLINSYASLILPFASSAFGIFMLRQTFMQVPEALLEVARLDHASEFKILWKVMLPIARPTVVTLVLFSFITAWNDYFWPFVLTTNNDVRTLPVGIASLFNSSSGVNYQIVYNSPLKALFHQSSLYLKRVDS